MYKTMVDDKGQLRIFVENMWRKAEWRECWFCGKKFPFSTNWADRKARNFKTGLFCSLKCGGRWRAKEYAKTRITKRCVICLNFFKVSRSQVLRHKTCGEEECKFKYKSINALKYQASLRVK